MKIFEIRQKLSEQEQKTAPSLYFRADFNNSPTILTRIVSRFRFFIRNLNPTSAVRLALFSKYVTENCLLFEQFSSDFNDSHVNLTRIVSQFHSCFRNKNRTSVAQTATILVCVIEFPRQNWAGWMTHHVLFSGGPHSHCLWYDGTSKSTLKAAMSYITYTRWIAWEKSKKQ